ncbi:MAG: IclR family transcriptional regulator [Bacillota bacterium]
MDSLRTVQRALDIINCFSLQNKELTLTEISSTINLAKSTTSRLLSTLEMNGFVIKDTNTLKYKLGYNLYYLGYIAGKSIQIKEVAYPFMQSLRNETKETVNLYIIEEEYRVCIEQCESPQQLRHLVKIGERLPLWSGAGGKVLLAYQDKVFQQQILASNPIRKSDEIIKRDLDVIQAEGFALSQDERELGLSAIAAPIFSVDNKVNACLSISGPTQRFSQEVMEQFKAKLIHQAAKISECIGFKKNTTGK